MPIDRQQLQTPEQRESALDGLGRWIVDQLAVASDDAAARAIMVEAIQAFYDVREAADQYRGEYAGHFFLVDAVGIEDTSRPVPWEELALRVGGDRLDRLGELFAEAERDAR